MPPINLDISTIGASMLAVAAPLTAAIVKFVPGPRARHLAKNSAEVAVLTTELKYIKEDVTEIKQDVRRIWSRLNEKNPR